MLPSALQPPQGGLAGAPEDGSGPQPLSKDSRTPTILLAVFFETQMGLLASQTGMHDTAQSGYVGENICARSVL